MKRRETPLNRLIQCGLVDGYADDNIADLDHGLSTILPANVPAICSVFSSCNR